MKIIVVVGGGPAGMMAAIRASNGTDKVILVEKNRSLGTKLLLTGKGRCNLTNMCSLDSFLKSFSGNAAFLRDAFKGFFNKELVSFFEDRKLGCKVERQDRVFPVTDKARSVLDVLRSELQQKHVRIYYDAVLKEILVSEGSVQGVLLEGGRKIACSKLILATGGVSYKETGSTGTGIELARKLGHRITPLRPALVAVHTKEQYPQKLEGLTLKNIQLTFIADKKRSVSDVGELLFTKSGITGPLIFLYSGRIGDWLLDKKSVSVALDMKPGLTREKLDTRILRDISQHPKMTLIKAFKELLPGRMITALLDYAEVPGGITMSSLTKIQRLRIVDSLKSFRLTILDTGGFSRAMITRGGVSLKDIDPKTMQSRLVPGLYFAGEMIDIDGETGGFNLQAAFSTGYLAGISTFR